MRDLDPVGESQSPSMLPPVTDVDSSFSRAPGAPVREGLPASYRMRADAHYVDQLDASPATAVQVLSVDAIDAGELLPAVSSELIESVRRFGVLEPLLVQRRDRRYRLVAGRRRYAAARAVGLRDVPCAVRRLTEDEVAALAERRAIEPARAGSGTLAAAPAGAVLPVEELATALSSVLSCADLLADSIPPLTRRVAVDMIRAEVQRAICALRMSAAVQQERADVRRPVSARQLLDQLSAAIAAEVRLRGAVVSTHVDVSDEATVVVDESAVVSALAAVVLMLSAALHDRPGARLRISAACDPRTTLTLTLAYDGVILPTPTLTAANQIPTGDPDAPVMPLIALRRVVETHGGTFSVGRLPRGTQVSVTLPIDEFV